MKIGHTILSRCQLKTKQTDVNRNGQFSFFKPIIQPKLTINQPNDIYEQEADAVAEQVMRMPAGENAFFKPAVNFIQRKCSHCEEEEKVQMKEEAGAIDGITTSSTVHNVINSTGEPLDIGARNFMESRFGFDFGNVKIHNTTNAHESSAAINALAYTKGSHVVFGARQYNPATYEGRQLLAHELTHVIQQNSMDHPDQIQRMEIGKGDRPKYWSDEDGDVELKYVPEEEEAKVNAAIEIVRDIVNDKSLGDCHSFYKDNCPNHESMKQNFDKALIWKYPEKEPELAGAYTYSGTPNIGYTYVGFKQNDAEGLAGIFLHEMMHCCGITGPNLHALADKAKLYCLQKHNKASLGFGKQHGGYTVMLSYRYFLRQLSLGKLTPTVGADFNVKGDDLFSVMVGTQYRSNLLWGGEEFGGLTLGAEIGLAGGKFRKMTDSESEKTGWSSGLVLQLKAGAEFAIPDLTRWGKGSEGRRAPFFVEGAYRWVKPLNGEAEKIHEVVVQAGFIW